MSIRKLLSISFVLTIAAVMQAQQVVRMEYFIDTDPGHGKGHSISNLQLGDNQLTFEFGNAAPGAHVLGVRAQDSDGNWSQTISRTFLIADNMEAQDPVRMEYFLDTDPGYGKGRILNNIRIGENELVFDGSDAEPGPHVLGVRSQDVAGRWSQTISRTIYAIKPVGNIVAVEYFFDSDPGKDKGNILNLPTDLSDSFAFEVPIDNLSAGVHQFYVRVKDSDGNWSVLRSAEVEVIDLSGINSVELNEKLHDIYDLQGRKLTPEMISREGKNKRIYIIDGRKVIMK